MRGRGGGRRSARRPYLKGAGHGFSAVGRVGCALRGAAGPDRGGRARGGPVGEGAVIIAGSPGPAMVDALAGAAGERTAAGGTVPPTETGASGRDQVLAERGETLEPLRARSAPEGAGAAAAHAAGRGGAADRDRRVRAGPGTRRKGRDLGAAPGSLSAGGRRTGRRAGSWARRCGPPDLRGHLVRMAEGCPGRWCRSAGWGGLAGEAAA